MAKKIKVPCRVCRFIYQECLLVGDDCPVAKTLQGVSDPQVWETKVSQNASHCDFKGVGLRPSLYQKKLKEIVPPKEEKDGKTL